MLAAYCWLFLGTSYTERIHTKSHLLIDSKAEWRKWFKEKRKHLPTKVLSQKICKVIMKWPLFQEAKHILTYKAFDSEFDLSALESLTDKKFYLTRTWMESRSLTVHSIDAPLERHPFGYWQPKALTPSIDPKVIDMALVPGLCFDQKGTRLGYGMGFYDRFLLSLNENADLVGITAQELLVEVLPKDKFDLPMTYLVNETEISDCRLWN